MVFAVKKFRSYLLPRPFFFLTSQLTLQFLVRKSNLAGKFAKWICELQEFSFTFTRGIVGLDSTKMSMNGVEVVRYARHMESNWSLDL